MQEIRFFVKYSDIQDDGRIIKLDSDCTAEESGVLFRHDEAYLAWVIVDNRGLRLHDEELDLIPEIQKANPDESLACLLYE